MFLYKLQVGMSETQVFTICHTNSYESFTDMLTDWNIMGCPFTNSLNVMKVSSQLPIFLKVEKFSVYV